MQIQVRVLRHQCSKYTMKSKIILSINYSSPAINSNDLVFDDNKPIKKCQKCFMIFSRTMSDIDQAKHISEHDNY